MDKVGFFKCRCIGKSTGYIKQKEQTTKLDTPFFLLGREKTVEKGINPGIDLIFFFLKACIKICDHWLPREERLRVCISALSVLFAFLTMYLYDFYALECQHGLSGQWDYVPFSFLLYALFI